MKEHFEMLYWSFLLAITLIWGKNEVDFVSKFFAESDFCAMVRMKDIRIFKLICVPAIDIVHSFPLRGWAAPNQNEPKLRHWAHF